jgi:hypothetical protein
MINLTTQFKIIKVIGVGLLDVEKAALELQGRGKNPSVDAIREVLGTGSKSTIAQHLAVLQLVPANVP